MLMKITEPLLRVELRRSAGDQWNEFESYREATDKLRDWAYFYRTQAEYRLSWANGMTYESTIPLSVCRDKFQLAPHVRAELYAQACGPCDGELAERTNYARDLIDLCDTGKTEDLEAPFSLQMQVKAAETTHDHTIRIEKPVARSSWFWVLVDTWRENLTALYAATPEQVAITRC